MSLQRRRKTCERLIVFVPPRWSPNYAFDGFNGCKKGGSITHEESLLHKKKYFFNFAKNKRPITIVLWHLDTNYIIFRNVENLKNYFFSKKNKS
jgi:hypothetical protein